MACGYEEAISGAVYLGERRRRRYFIESIGDVEVAARRPVYPDEELDRWHGTVVKCCSRQAIRRRHLVPDRLWLFRCGQFPLGLLHMSIVDTTPQADIRYHELLRRMPPERRLEAAIRLSQAVRELALAGIRARHPGADGQELRVRLTVRLYGRDCARRLFGRVPDDAT